MAIKDLTKWKWKSIEGDDGMFLWIGGAEIKSISMPRIRDINMIDGIITVEERFLVAAVDEGDLFVLSLHLASEDAIEWVTSQVAERAKSPY